MNKKDMLSMLDDLLRPELFSRKGSTWYRQGSEVLQVVDFQKSNYGFQFFLNICFVPAGMSIRGMPTPKEQHCPIRIRMSSLFPQLRSRLENALNFEGATLSDAERLSELLELMNEVLLPFLSSVETLEDLHQQLLQGAFKRGSVDVDAKEYFGLTT